MWGRPSVVVPIRLDRDAVGFGGELSEIARYDIPVRQVALRSHLDPEPRRRRCDRRRGDLATAETGPFVVIERPLGRSHPGFVDKDHAAVRYTGSGRKNSGLDA